MLMDDIGDGLGIRCRTGSTAVDSVVDVGEFIGHSVGLNEAEDQRATGCAPAFRL